MEEREKAREREMRERPNVRLHTPISPITVLRSLIHMTNAVFFSTLLTKGRKILVYCYIYQINKG